MQMPEMIQMWIQETDLYLTLISVTMATNGLFKVIRILAHWVNNIDRKKNIKVEQKQITLMSYHIAMTVKAVHA